LTAACVPLNQLYCGLSPAATQKMLVQSAAKPCVMLSPAAAILVGSGGVVVLVLDVELELVVELVDVLELEDVLLVDDVLVVELVVDEVEVVLLVEVDVVLDVLDVVLLDEVEVLVLVDDVVEEVVIRVVLVVVVDTGPGHTPSLAGWSTLKSLVESFASCASDPYCTL